MNIWILTTSLLIIRIKVKAFGIRQMPVYKQRMLELPHFAITNLGLPLLPLTSQRRCFVNNLIIRCPVISTDIVSNAGRNTHSANENAREEQTRIYGFGRAAVENLEDANDKALRAHNFTIPSLGAQGEYSLSLQPSRMMSNNILPARSKLNLKLESSLLNNFNMKSVPKIIDLKRTLHSPSISTTVSTPSVTVTTTTELSTTTSTEAPVVLNLAKSLDAFERKLYATTFEKLTAMSPASRRENGMSFVQSGLFLQLALMTFLNESDTETSLEIENCLGFHITNEERLEVINATVNSLPESSDDLKFRWSTRLVVRNPDTVSEQFRSVAAPAMRLLVSSFNASESAKEMADALNGMVEEDSGGAIHDTFEEEDFSDGMEGILLTTLYFRSRWRSSPTLLNGTRRFRDSDTAPQRAVRMIRINDNMRYANLTDWDAEALEIFYSTAGLSLLMLIPRGNLLRGLVDHAANASLEDIGEKMQYMRITATLPLYTLRMTLLLPNKLQAMGITHLLDTKNVSQSEMFRLSHAVQRIMFWAEAGRNAFKDDGLEWDEAPERELMVDRPYIFYVRWKNKTLMSGNFVL